MEMTKEELKGLFIDALKDAKGLCLAYRPRKVKFDESRATIRLDLDSYNGFLVGDLCIFKKGMPTWYDEYKEWKRGPSLSSECRIAAFVELVGWLKGGRGIRIKDMFCVLAKGICDKQGSGGGGNGGGNYRIYQVNENLLLFWVEGLLKK